MKRNDGTHYNHASHFPPTHKSNQIQDLTLLSASSTAALLPDLEELEQIMTMEEAANPLAINI
jgi:hypothetical protein